MGNSADWTNAPDANVSGGPNTKNEGYDDAVPRYEAPAASHDDGGMLSSEEGELINYKTLNWWQGGIVLIAETVSLGILSLPSVLATVGLVPGIVLILVMSALSTYSGVVLAEFRRAYPFVQNFGDAVEVMGQPIGMGRLFQEIFGWAQVVFQVFVMGSHLLTWTICLNTLTNSSTCTIVWAVVGLAVFWVLNLPRTLKWTSYMSMTSCLSITVAMLMTLGDVATEKPIGSGSIEVARHLGFTGAFLAVTNIAVAFSSHSCFFSVIGEFKNPDDWPKALALLQICDTTLYLLAAIVIYVYVGQDVPSPALSAAHSPTMRKAIWGYIFSRMFRDTKHMIRRTKLSFASWFSYGLPGIFWLWMHKGNYFSSKAQTCRFFANVVLFLTGFLICVLGLWASIEAIATEKGTKPWTCASNAAE
ncbi:N amino acid transport system protein like [Verticillium longisporum]|uniref:N amino acid transport system protein like n=1 Tax=Verticillium longisporum TaxID=100787 RepID=A0A8I2ZRC2_VERLO|nr:N amino acid transport system protein like [Verticillium longisporum]